MKPKIVNHYRIGDNHYGKAVYATSEYKEGDIVVMFGGPILHKKNVPNGLFGENDRYMQISPTKFMGPSNTVDDYINHSCDPNTGLKFTDSGIMLVAIKSIKNGDEITWDYSTTLYKSDWTMKCLCRSKKCRKIIEGFETLPSSTKKKYFKLGILPGYISRLCHVSTKAI